METCGRLHPHYHNYFYQLVHQLKLEQTFTNSQVIHIQNKDNILKKISCDLKKILDYIDNIISNIVFAPIYWSLLILLLIKIGVTPNFYKINFLNASPLTLSIHIEPTFVALSFNHLAVGFNNRVWFYSFQNETDNNQEEKRQLKFDPNFYFIN
ncbi:hypothetical protein BpHYR1_035871 [Brachionus plicatilis]|uniref:WDR19 WD40 repeat domain-containing protein n=1 Tax=Brachionus plicatilis TaxID=10195 RepID=A0A3M7SKB2_BRAPC|nr:hypothetical protein BpHYR1_035871 [Brachionus plicatilis]